MWWFALGSTPLQGEITEEKYIIVGRFAAQNTDFIARSDGAGDVLWSRAVCFGLVEGGCANLYRFTARPIGDCCGRVLPSVYCAKTSCAQLPDMPLRRDTQALRLIARIPLIQRREKCPSREEKSAFP